jgi:hypothetical protein
MLETGKLARAEDSTEKICLVLSLDPPTRCCGWEPCNHPGPHRRRPKSYAPKARVVWQSGPKAGQESIVMAHLLKNIETE